MFMRGSLEEARRLTYPFSPFPNTRGTCTLCIAAHSYVRGEGPVGAKGFSPGPLLNTSLKYFPPAITGAVAEIYSRFHTLPRVNSPPPRGGGKETRVSFEKRSRKESTLEFIRSRTEDFLSKSQFYFELWFFFFLERKDIFISRWWKWSEIELTGK